ncbi:MAG: hypothetical protein JWL67_2319, partial [Solirubrobacterales bacterium]|nr:hypothetical protein [Solirubrobacterales bacterium]
YHIWRNSIWVVAKDLPLAALLRHAHQLLLGQLINLAVAIRDRKIMIWLRVWRDMVRGLPSVLKRRREVQSHRRLSLRELEAVVGIGEPAARNRS